MDRASTTPPLPDTACAARSRAALRSARTSPASKQFSGHASLKSLGEYIEVAELRHNHPLEDIL
jgi:hypothetical protein